MPPIASFGSLILPHNPLWHKDPHSYPWIHFFHSFMEQRNPPTLPSSTSLMPVGHHPQPCCKSHPGVLDPLGFLDHPHAELYSTWAPGSPLAHTFLTPSPGHIDVSEIQQSFRALGISISLEQAEKILHR